jgi:hypothetical protein
MRVAIMSPESSFQRKLPRVGPPAVRAEMTCEPVEPHDEQIVTGPLIHVRHPLIQAEWTCEPVEAPSLELTVRPVGDADAAAARFTRLIDSLSEYERKLGGAGVTRDPVRSRAEPGTVTLVLVPNDPVGAEERLEALGRVAVAAGEFAGESVRAEVKRQAA